MIKHAALKSIAKNSSAQIFGLVFDWDTEIKLSNLKRLINWKGFAFEVLVLFL